MARTKLSCALITSLLALALIACDGDGGGGEADVQTQPGADVIETNDASASSDVGTPADVADQADSATQSDADSDTSEPWPPFDPTVCGMTPHEWIRPDEDSRLGEVLEFAELDFMHYAPAETVNVLLDQLDYGAVGPVSYGVKNYRMRYMTQDRGELREATAIVGVPVGAPEGETLPVAIWMHHSVGFVDDCAPSRDPWVGPAPAIVMGSRGYVTVAPDLLGLMGSGEPSPPGTVHPYHIAEPTALAALDAARALLTAVADDEELTNGDPQRVVVIGGSQGGHASFFVDRYAPHYAPEFDIVAIATAVPPTDVVALAEHAFNNWSPTSRTFPGVIEAMRQWYGGPEDLTDVLTDGEPHYAATNIFDILGQECRFEIRLDGVEGLEDLYDADFVAAAAAGAWDEIDPWGCYFAENSVSRTSVPRVKDTPVLTIFAEDDDLVPLSEEQADVLALCAQGYRIQYEECAAIGHTHGGRAAAAHLIDWLDERVAGTPWPAADQCVIKEPFDCEAEE